jgi:Tfp pilus assembly protein FimT
MQRTRRGLNLAELFIIICVLAIIAAVAMILLSPPA